MHDEEELITIMGIKTECFNLAKNIFPYIDPDTINIYAILFLATAYNNSEELYANDEELLKEMQSEKNNQRKDLH
jgi:predicted nucleic acid-binding protein